MSSPTVTFNLRNLVGARRDPVSDGPSPAPRLGVVYSDSADTESDASRPVTRLGALLRPRTESVAASETVRQESERPTASPINYSQAANNRSASTGSNIFKYSSATSVASASGAAATAADNFYTRPAVVPAAAPTTEDVRRRFEELDLDARSERASSAHSRGVRVAAQVVSSPDFVPYPHVNADRLSNPSRSTSPNNAPPFVYSSTRGGGGAPVYSGFAGRQQSAPNDFGSVTQSVYDGDDDDRRSNYTTGSRSLRGSAINGRRGPQRDDDAGRPEYAAGAPSHTSEATYVVEEPNDDVPVVPADLLRTEAKPYPWDQHPSHHLVLNLLDRRGATVQTQPELVEYHMAPAFLDFLSVCAAGTYFIKYGFKGTTPKERFLSLRMLPLDSETNRMIACLVMTVHQDGVQIIDRVRLEDLIGITMGVAGNAAFARHLVDGHLDVIKGGYIGQHRARLSTKGAFTLWFSDRKNRNRFKVLPLLTTNMSAVQVWTQCMEGIRSVNSVCVQRTNVAYEMQKRVLQLQALVNEDGYESS